MDVRHERKKSKIFGIRGQLPTSKQDTGDGREAALGTSKENRLLVTWRRLGMSLEFKREL